MADADFPRAAEAILQPGIILRYQQNMGEASHDLQFEGAIDRDATLDEFNELADKLRRVAARQKAIVQLPTLRRQRKGMVERLADNMARKAGVEAKLKVFAEERETQRKLALGHRQRIENDARAEHQASGRRGEWEPRGATKANLERIQQQLDQLDAGQTKDEAEARIQLSTLEGEIKEATRARDQLDELIAAAVELAPELAE